MKKAIPAVAATLLLVSPTTAWAARRPHLTIARGRQAIERVERRFARRYQMVVRFGACERISSDRIRCREEYGGVFVKGGRYLWLAFQSEARLARGHVRVVPVEPSEGISSEEPETELAR